MTQRRTLCLAAVLWLTVLMSNLPGGRAQRSPYVPMPVNLPGLLPRFGQENGDDGGNQASSSSASSSSSSTGGGDEDLGGRLGEGDRRVPPRLPASPPSRGGSSTTSSSRCPPQQVPCYDCVVHISSNGQITRYTTEGGGRRW